MRTWLTRHWLDALIVLLAVLAQVEAWIDPAEKPHAVASVAALLWTLPLLLRRRYPLGAPVVVFTTLGLESLLPGQVVTSSQANVFALLAAFGVAGTHPVQRAALIGGSVGFVALAAIVLNEVPASENAVPVFLVGAGAWALAREFAERDRRARQSEERAERLEREHAGAVLAERGRIARELHDVVAHSVSVMTVQAGAARLLLGDDPARARESLVAVEATGREALAEMRRLLGVLRGSDEEAALAPQPGMAQLGALVAQVKAAGLPVDVAVEGEPEPLAAGVDLTAYRIVQEALTNVLRHAGAARAHVRIRYAPGHVEIEVTNSGHVASNGRPGHGLIGMRQRVALYGGEFDAGPAPEGGYGVRARIPVGAGSQ